MYQLTNYHDPLIFVIFLWAKTATDREPRSTGEGLWGRRGKMFPCWWVPHLKNMRKSNRTISPCENKTILWKHQISEGFKPLHSAVLTGLKTRQPNTTKIDHLSGVLNFTYFWDNCHGNHRWVRRVRPWKLPFSPLKKWFASWSTPFLFKRAPLDMRENFRGCKSFPQGGPLPMILLFYTPYFR